MRPLVIACALGGVTLLVALVLLSSPAAIVAILLSSPTPLAAVSLYRVVPLAFYAVSWRFLIAPGSRPATATLLRLRWIGESVNALLPVAQVGGDLARARLLAQRGAPIPIAAASMVADLGMGAATQVVFTATGAIAFSLHGSLGALSHGILIVCVALAAGAGALVFVARVGVGRILRRLPMFQRRRVRSARARRQCRSRARRHRRAARRSGDRLRASSGRLVLAGVRDLADPAPHWPVACLGVGCAGDREPGAGRAQRGLRGAQAASAFKRVR